MQFKIVEHYYPVTLTKRSQLCKAKQFFKRFGNIQITGNIKIKLTSSFPAANFMFKVNNRNTRISVKYVQSQQ